MHTNVKKKRRFHHGPRAEKDWQRVIAYNTEESSQLEICVGLMEYSRELYDKSDTPAPSGKVFKTHAFKQSWLINSCLYCSYLQTEGYRSSHIAFRLEICDGALETLPYVQHRCTGSHYICISLSHASPLFM